MNLFVVDEDTIEVEDDRANHYSRFKLAWIRWPTGQSNVSDRPEDEGIEESEPRPQRLMPTRIMA